VIVADDGEDAAVLRGACGVRVLQHVHRAVEARAFAIPDAEHAIELAVRIEADVLRAPDGGGAKLFIDARNETNVLRFEELLGPPELLIVGAKRGAAIARDEPGGVDARRAIACFLDEREPDQRLHTAHEHAPVFEQILVAERDGGLGGHVSILPQ
jgi:hypothetical protein